MGVGWGICPLEPLPPLVPQSEGKIGQNQPFSATFWILPPTAICPLDATPPPPKKKNSGAATVYILHLYSLSSRTTLAQMLPGDPFLNIWVLS